MHVTTALLVAVPSGSRLAAQIVSKLEAVSTRCPTALFRSSATPLRSVVRVDASVREDHRARLSVALGPALQIADGIVSGTFTSPTVYGVRAEMLGNASRAMDDRSLGTDQVDVQTRVHVLFHDYGGMWFGGGVARPWRVAVISSADVADAGVWTKLGDATSKFGVATLHDDVHELLVQQDRRAPRHGERGAFVLDRDAGGERRRDGRGRAGAQRRVVHE